jgi:hypothetical protein
LKPFNNKDSIIMKRNIEAAERPQGRNTKQGLM